MWAASEAAGTFWALPHSSKLSLYIVSSAVTLQGCECLPASQVGVRQVSSYEPLYWAHSTALVIAPCPTDQTSPYLGPSTGYLESPVLLQRSGIRKVGCPLADSERRSLPVWQGSSRPPAAVR